MNDLTPEQCAAFDSHHDAVSAFLSRPSVAAVVEAWLAGSFPSLGAFVSAFLAVPEVHSAILLGESIAADAIGVVVAGAVAGIGLAPLSGIAGGAANALVRRGLEALDAKLTSQGAPTPGALPSP